MPPKTSSPETAETETGREKLELSPHGKNVFRDASPEQIDHLEAVGGRSTALSMLHDELSAKLSSVTDRKEKSGITNQLRRIGRERERIQKFDSIRRDRNQNDEQREFAKTLAEKYKSVENVPAKELLRLETMERGTLSRMYAFKEMKDSNGNAVENPVKIEDISEGDTIRIDFGRNANANSKIGAGHLLPTNVEVVKIVDDSWNVRIGRRMVVDGQVGYYDQNGKYLPIYSGYRIRIPTKAEISSPEYATLGVSSVINTDLKALEARNQEESVAMESFAKTLEAGEASDRTNDVLGKLRREAEDAGTYANYRERLAKTVEIGRGHLSGKNPEYDQEILKSVVERLSKTLEILGTKDAGFDLDRYKASIARHEDKGMGYFARNDEWGKSHGIAPEKWAFGKYQFTVETLWRYGVDLGIPPLEDRIRKFLNDPALQEEIMDRFTMSNFEKAISGNSKVMEEIASGKESVVAFLAMAHNGGPGAVKNRGSATDYMSGRTAHSYATAVSNTYEGSLGTLIAETPRRVRTEAYAETMDREDLVRFAEEHLGKPYVYGANGEKAIDCSQLVVESMKRAGIVASTHDNTAAGFFDQSVPKPVSDVRRGDLVFLSKGGRITHVEIALGPVEHGKIPIIDASSNAGKVSKRFQTVGPSVRVGEPLFVG